MAEAQIPMITSHPYNAELIRISVTRKTFALEDWRVFIQWAMDNFDKRVLILDSEDQPVPFHRLKVWLTWDGDRGNNTVTISFTIQGPTDLMVWFRMKYL